MKRIAVTLLVLSLNVTCAAAPIAVTDDSGHTVQLARPAQRIISLAPHVTELLFAAGGAAYIVGAVEYSDYPEAARHITRIGSNREIDIERVIALKPDLIVAWRHNSAERQLDVVRRLGVPIFQSDPQTLEAIPDSIRRLGVLLGTTPSAATTADNLLRELHQLRSDYAGRTPVRAFYQVWDKPLYTLNGKYIVSNALQLCGATNIFSSLPVIAPVVSIESVLQSDPDAIIATAEKSYGGVGIWAQYPMLKAVRSGHLFTLNGDLLNRAGPRMIEGTRRLCEAVDRARQQQNR